MIPARVVTRSRFTIGAAAVVAVLAGPVRADAQAASGATALAMMTQRGSDAAPVTILEFSDFECPFCARMPSVLDELLKKYPDKVRLVFKHIPLPMHPRSPLAHEAALAAGEQGKFWQMHDLLFANQSRLTPEDLDRYAGHLQLDVARFRRALENHDYRPIVSRDAAEAAALGVNATPTFFINGRRLLGAQTFKTLEGLVEDLLTGRGSQPSAAASVAPESLNIENAPVRGGAKAPVTIVEFSDLQCPFCARANASISDVVKRYGADVKIVFKNFPLDIHPNAPLAHRAALAAGEQGKFWEMHDALFAKQSNATRDGVLGMARELGLDLARFQSDFESGRFDTRIERDKQEGDRLGVDGTPTFFINGARLVGAQPTSEFVRVIDRELDKASAANPAVIDAAANRALGSKDAPVTITWFGDLRSPLNAEASQLMRQIATTYERVRVVFKNSPLRNRDESVLAYEAALAAGAQGRFWEMEDLLSENQSLNTLEALVALATQLKLDAPRFESNVKNRMFRSVAAAAVNDAERQGVRGTPTFFVDDERVDGIVTLDALKEVVDRHLRANAARPPGRAIP